MSLTPPDLDQCQADKPTGHSFMTLGGQPGKLVRCTEKPKVIITENGPGDDGHTGSMALCGACLHAFNAQDGTPDVEVKVI